MTREGGEACSMLFEGYDAACSNSKVHLLSVTY
jgi:hypothetical protein